MKINLLIKYFIILCLISLSGCASNLFYLPDRITYSTPPDYGLSYESLFFNSIDGTKLHAWYIPSKTKQKGLVIHYHGNSRNISGHISQVAWLPKAGYSLFMFDYRGYGLSSGHAERVGLHLDSVAALNYVLDHLAIGKETNIFVLGQSLGGANAIDAVASIQGKGLKALIIDSTFTSYQDIVVDKAKSISFASGSFASTPELLTNNQYSPKDSIKNVPIPVLFIHGTDDQVIPLDHSKELFNLANEPKKMWTIEKGYHLSTFKDPVNQKKLIEYLEQFNSDHSF